MFGTIFLLVFNADFNAHMVCTMAVDNLFRFFVIISVRKENILKVEYDIFYRMTYRYLAKSKFIARKLNILSSITRRVLTQELRGGCGEGGIFRGEGV